MKKELVIVGITLVLLAVSLSGCETKQDGNQLNGTEDEIELEGKIAFLSAGNIYVINPDGTNEIRLAEGVLPAWSPDGEKIAYGYYGINIMNSDGTDKIEIVNYSDIQDISISDFSWSPDGKKTLITSLNAIDGGLYIINVDGSNLVRLVEGWCFGATFSPDGKKIVYGGPAPGQETKDSYWISTCCLYIMNSDGTDKTILCEGERGYWLMYSPDGNKISYLDSSHEGDLYVMNSDGTNKVKLVENVVWPAWSPDGKKISYYIDSLYTGGFFVMNSDGTGKNEIVSTAYKIPSSDEYQQYCWSPDGKKIVYSVEDKIYVINIDGSGLTELAVGFYPQWSPS